MMTYRRQQLINQLISTAIKEEINAVGFALPELIPHLKRVQSELCDAGKRITFDIGRQRRLLQLCKLKTTR
jgi:hypothetical protein